VAATVRGAWRSGWEAVHHATVSRLERYESGSAGALTVLAFVFLAAYGAPIIWPDLPASVVSACAVANVAIWAVFAADLVVRVALSPRRLQYLLRHPLDVLTVVVPVVRPLRVLRIFAAGHLLLTRGRGLIRSGQAIVFAAAVLILVGALAMLDAERSNPDANITTFPDALWWAITTVTTVGYGDRFPVTGVGRVVAASLMLVGISLLGVVTAAVAAWFIREDAEGATLRSTSTRLAELEQLRSERLITDDEYTGARARVLESLVE
jgi:voltage-gated potassium channel